MRLMLPMVHTSSRDYLAVSTSLGITSEVFKAHKKCSIFNFLPMDDSVKAAFARGSIVGSLDLMLVLIVSMSHLTSVLHAFFRPIYQ